VDLQKCVKGKLTHLAGPVEFNVIPLENKSIPVENRQELYDFQKDLAELARRMYGASELTNQLLAKIKHIKQTILAAAGPSDLLEQAEALETRLEELQFKLHGLQPKASWEEIPPAEMPLMYRLESIIYAHIRSTALPTKTQHESYNLLNKEIMPLYEKLNKIANEDIKKLEDRMNEQKYPWTKGRVL
jgi:septal ring factor EnvC (AmiA/AmiB activator)